MIQKIKNILSNKYLRLLLPLLVIILILLGEYLFDKILGDGDGEMSHPLVIKAKPFLISLLLIDFILILLIRIFCVEKKAAVFNLIFFIICLYILEFVLYKKDPFIKSAFDSNYYYANINKYSNLIKAPDDYRGKNTLTWGNPVRRNNLNYRGRDILIPKPTGVFRIMVLGDSFTWGVGLKEEERYSSLLDSSLSNYFKDMNIEVVNCGRASASTMEERDSLIRLKNMIQPDMIIVGFCQNDPQPKYENYSEELEKFDDRWANIARKIQINLSILKLNYVGDILSKLIYKLGESFGSYPEWTEALSRAYDQNSEEWKSFIVALKEIKSTSDSMHCLQPVLGAFNQIGSIDTKEKMPEEEMKKLKIRQGWFKQVVKAAHEIGYDAIDYEPVFEELIGKIKITNLPVSPLDGHPSALLNKLYAGELFKHTKIIIEQANKTKLKTPQ